MLNIDNSETKFALNAVRLASQLVKQVQLEMTSPGIAKEDRSPVTIVRLPGTGRLPAFGGVRG
jgi:hypothetical protein